MRACSPEARARRVVGYLALVPFRSREGFKGPDARDDDKMVYGYRSLRASQEELRPSRLRVSGTRANAPCGPTATSWGAKRNDLAA